MRFRYLPLALLACVTAVCAAGNRVVGYFPSWLQYSQFTPDNVRYEFITEIRYTSMVPSESGALALTDDNDAPNVERLAELAEQNKVDFVISVGGLGYEDAMRSLSDESVLNGFIESAKQILEKYKADAIEIDWVPQEESEYTTFKSIVKSLAGAGIKVMAVLGNDVSAVGSYEDALNELASASIYFTDEVTGESSSVAPNANLKQATEVMKAYVDAGVAAEKIIPIIPMYGRSFYKGQGLGSSFEGVGSGNEGVLQYKDLMKTFDGPEYKVTFDEASWSEVAVSKDETIVFNGIPSFKAFAEFVKSSGFGGVALYDISGDFNEPIVSLVVTVGKVLRPDVNYKAKKKKK